MSVLTPMPCSRSLSELSEKLPEILFTNSWQPSKRELTETYRQISLFHQAGRLNSDNITLYQQRLIASLVVLDAETKNTIGNILESSNIWSSCIEMFKTRLDSLTVEIIINDIGNILERATADSKLKIIKDIDSLAQVTISRVENTSSEQNTIQSVRLSNIKKLTCDYTFNNKSISWLKGVVKDQIKSQIATVSIFNNFMRNSKNFQRELARDSNSFLMTYLKNGHVRNVWIYAEQSVFDNLSSNQQAHCEQLASTNFEQMLLLVQIGNHIWVQTNRLESFGIYKLPKNYNNLQVLISQIIDKKNDSHYLFTSKGFWQYKLSLSFKRGTNFIPKRSDYLTN
jgi:hypothetical protein